MPATTTNLGLPYPLPTDPIADGANQIKALAEVLDMQVKPLKIEIMQKHVSFDYKSSYYLYKGEIEIEKPDGFTSVVGAYCAYFNAIGNDQSNFLAWQAVRDVEIRNNKIVLKYETWRSGYPDNVTILVFGY